MSNSITAFIPNSPDRISMSDLSIKIGCSDRELRKCINTARAAGEVICSDDRGYFIPVSDNEVLKHYRSARKRALSTLKGLKAERKRLKAAGVDVRPIEGKKKSNG